jgi:uncharacterized membrane protein YeiH
MNATPLQNLVEHTAVAVAAIGGVLAARGNSIDLFGLVVLALVTAFGGGTVRDALVGDFPVVWLRVPDYLLNASVTALLTFAFVRRCGLPLTALLVADAFALALFTIIGTAKGHALSLSPPVCVLLGVVTGVAGGIVRDVLLGEIPLVFPPQIHLYATAALAGSAVRCSEGGQPGSMARNAHPHRCGAGVAIEWNLAEAHVAGSGNSTAPLDL